MSNSDGRSGTRSLQEELLQKFPIVFAEKPFPANTSPDILIEEIAAYMGHLSSTIRRIDQNANDYRFKHRHAIELLEIATRLPPEHQEGACKLVLEYMKTIV